MSTPIQPVPEVILAPPFPTLADRPAGLYNQMAAAWANGENLMVTRAREIALVTHSNAVAAWEGATAAEAFAIAAAGTVATVQALANAAAGSAADAAADATKTAADRAVVEQALIDGPVLSVNGQMGIVDIEADIWAATLAI